MSNLLTHAEREFSILSALAKEPDNRPLVEPFRKEILALVEAFGNSGQSGGSAPITARVISQTVEKLCLFTPIAPLTGEDSEWNDVNDGLLQNNRCSAVFSENGKAHYLDAVIFCGEDSWDQFVGKVEDITSRQFLKGFPFTPKKFFINVTRERFSVEKHGMIINPRIITCGDGDYIYFIKDRKELEPVFEYYDKYTE
jgi:hypothetical protein